MNVAGSFNIHTDIPRSWFAFRLKICASYITIPAGSWSVTTVSREIWVERYTEEGRVVEENRSGMDFEPSIAGMNYTDVLEVYIGPILHYLEVFYA